jgi:hypothetical protein
MTPLWESTKDVDFHRGLEKPVGFPTFPHRPGDETLITKQRGGSELLDQGGSLLRCQNECAARCSISLEIPNILLLQLICI